MRGRQVWPGLWRDLPVSSSPAMWPCHWTVLSRLPSGMDGAAVWGWWVHCLWRNLYPIFSNGLFLTQAALEVDTARTVALTASAVVASVTLRQASACVRLENKAMAATKVSYPRSKVKSLWPAVQLIHSRLWWGDMGHQLSWAVWLRACVWMWFCYGRVSLPAWVVWQEVCWA